MDQIFSLRTLATSLNACHACLQWACSPVSSDGIRSHLKKKSTEGFQDAKSGDE